MSINRTAQGLASLGRNGDSMLVHMTPGEVRGLQALGDVTGRKLTRNPHTGLHEAFDFWDVIPIVAGVVGSIYGGPVGGAAASGLASTAVNYGKGDDVGTAAGKGVVSGVTTYAGGQLMSGIGEIGAAGAAEAAGGAASGVAGSGAAQGAAGAAGQGIGEIGATGAGEVAGGITPTTAGSGYTAGTITPTGAGTAGSLDLPYPPPSIPADMPGANGQMYGPNAPPPSGIGARTTEGINRAGTNLSNVGSALTNSPGKVGSYLMANPMLAATALGGTYAQLNGSLDSLPRPNAPVAQRANLSPQFGQPRRRELTMPGDGYVPGQNAEFRYYAEGGLVEPSIALPDLSQNPSVGTFTPAPTGYRPGVDPQWNYYVGSGIQPYQPAAAVGPVEANPGLAAFGNLDFMGGGGGSGGGPGGSTGGDPGGGAAPGDGGPGGDASGSGGDSGMADGGGVRSLPEGRSYGTTENMMAEAQAAMSGHHPDPKGALKRFSDMFGEGAVDAMRKSFAGGGRIRGAGGGLDDLIPGTIEGRENVQLADGEFVVDAATVSGIGDGSSDAGVRRLEEMVDRVRRQKFKDGKQPGFLKAGTLPA